MTNFPGSTAKIAVEKVAQDLVHIVLAVLVLHHHVGGVLGQRFRHHVRALLLTADQLMTPPLMSQLVRRNEIRQVDIVLVQHATDETNPF